MTSDSHATLRLRRDPGVVGWRGGRVLMGGSPLRVLKLSERGARLAQSWWDGAPVAPGEASRNLARRLVAAAMAHPVYETGRMTIADVTVVVPVRDHAKGLALLRRSVGDVADLIVVDDGSRSPLPGAAIRHDIARGPAAARNAGCRLVRTLLVAFLDADTLPEPDWLASVLPHFEDPEVVAVAPRVRSLPGPSTLARYETLRSPVDLGSAPGPVRPGSRISYVPAAALVVRTSALRETGGFAEDMRFGEDVDLIWRLVGQGHQVRYEPSSVVGHSPRATWPSWLRQRFDYGTSAGPLALRHGRAVAPARLSLWSVVMWMSLLAGRIDVAVAVTGVSAVLLSKKLGQLGVPARDAAELAVRGNLASARILAEAVTRTWWPAALPLLARRRTGRIALGLIAARYAVEWHQLRPPMGPLRWTATRVLDDLAYGAGVAWGSLRSGTAAALTPDLSDVPWQKRPSIPIAPQNPVR
jgi:mycofactocin system glycosyltransferase